MKFQSTVLIVLLGSLFQPSLSQPLNCTKQCHHNSPVCASDGKMYRSKCEMEMKNCGKNVTVVDMNNCLENSTCPKLCLGIYDPVCGDDSKMYSNKCLMQKQNCGLRPVKVVDKSFCMETMRRSRRINDGCPKQCLLVDKPVCGSDLKLYRNECMMRQKNCGRKVTVVDIEKCTQRSDPCPKKCVTIPDPVCGSDGKWYLNQCWLRYENCGKPIGRASTEVCPGFPSFVSSRP